MKKVFILITLFLISFATGCDTGKEYINMSYYDQMTYEEGAKFSNINENIFYRNDYQYGKNLSGADPSIMKITDPEDPDYGYYYVFVTTGMRSFTAFKTRDLIHFENVGVILHEIESDTDEAKTLIKDTWAPEMVYDAEEKMYYLFASATPKVLDGETQIDYFALPIVAKSESPRGPFKLISHEDYDYVYTNETGETIFDETRHEYFLQFSPFDPVKMYEQILRLDESMPEDFDVDSEEKIKIMRAIDFHPFVDPVTNKKYLYFTNNKDNNATFTMACEMETWDSPIYETMTVLTRNKYYEVQGTEVAIYEKMSGINEGPCVVYHNGKYYLTISINGYRDKSYSVIQAVSDSPLGPFRKLTESEGGLLLSTDAMTMDNVSGPGHHGFIEIEGQLYILYHKHNDPNEGGTARHVAVERVNWITIKDIKGNTLDVMYVNGPNTSIQRLPDFASEYTNIANDAKVSATNLAEGSSVSYLVDGLQSIYKFANEDFIYKYVKETEFNGETVITFKFDDYRDIKALMIYNSKWMESAFYEIYRIEFDCLDSNQNKVTKVIRNLQFDWNAYTSTDDIDVIRSGSAAIAEFNETKIKEIRIVIKPATNEQIYVHGANEMSQLALGEIEIIGRG